MKRPFFTQAQPCESCGEPTSRPRIWSQHRQIWIAQDCQCSLPAAPIARAIIRRIEQARSVRQVRKIMSKEGKEAA